MVRNNISNFPQRPIFLFFILGQSTYNPYFEQIGDGIRSSSIVNYIPVIVQLCIASIALAFLFIEQTLFAIDYGRTSNSVTHIFNVCQLVTSLTVIVQSIISNNNNRDLCREYQDLDIYIWKKLGLELDYQKHFQRFQQCTVVLLTIFVSMPLSKWTLRTIMPDLIIGFNHCVLRFLATTSKVHIFYYVALMQFILKSIAMCIFRF